MMDNYNMLKDTFRAEKHRLESRLYTIQTRLTIIKKIKSTISLSANNLEENAAEKIFQLKRFFPNLKELFEDFRMASRLYWIIQNEKINEIHSNEIIDFFNKCSKVYDILSDKEIKRAKADLDNVDGVKALAMDAFNKEITNEIIKIAFRNFTRLNLCVEKLYNGLILKMINTIQEELDNFHEDDLLVEEEKIKNQLSLIEKYNAYFASDKLLTKFQDEEDLNQFISFIKKLLKNDEVTELLKMIKLDQEKEEVHEIKMDFENLDMSKFTEEEKDIIEEIREIIEDEDLKDNGNIFDGVSITYADRFNAYKKASVSAILYDAKSTLINNIYDKKEEVLKIFKLIIDLYQKDTVRQIREERIKELERIMADLNSIINFIRKTYLDKAKAYEEENMLQTAIENINNDCIPVLKELIEKEYYSDNDYDDEIETIITRIKIVIKKYKKRMTEYYQQSELTDDIKENTDNLVFCLVDDIDLSQEGLQKEFLGSIDALENKESIELKKRPGRKGMTRIRKTTENNKERDFIEYLEGRFHIRLHFVPYRYSSEGNYRTGLIKFETSAAVKNFLESRYGLAKQSAYYGVFGVISAIRADHSEYHHFEDYVLSSYLKIEELARLFISDNPDFEKLSSIIDKMLNIKHEIIQNINEKDRGQKK